MLQTGVQSKNVVDDINPSEGFRLLKSVGFSCADFSLNGYLLNTDIYQANLNRFFDASVQELERFFAPHKKAAREEGITINQMHMPYPIYVPGRGADINGYLQEEVAVKSMYVCRFFDCPHIVMHGLKLTRFLGSEEAEWAYTQRFIEQIAPLAKEMGIIICIENLYDGIGGHLIEGPCCNAKKAAERIDRINDAFGGEVLGFCLDTGHANLVGIDFEDFITALGGRLKVLHIHDNDGVRDLHQIPYTFTRTRENTSATDWEGFLSGLRRIRYDGVLSFETAPVLTSFPEGLKKEALAFIAQIGRYFAEKISGE